MGWRIKGPWHWGFWLDDPRRVPRRTPPALRPRRVEKSDHMIQSPILENDPPCHKKAIASGAQAGRGGEGKRAAGLTPADPPLKKHINPRQPALPAIATTGHAATASYCGSGHWLLPAQIERVSQEVAHRSAKQSSACMRRLAMTEGRQLERRPVCSMTMWGRRGLAVRGGSRTGGRDYVSSSRAGGIGRYDHGWAGQRRARGRCRGAD
jgi:hypothetical protein